MSLLRRRMMMLEQEKQIEENEPVIYIYKGYLDNKSTAESDPTHSTTFPDSVCSSAIYVDAGERLDAVGEGAPSTVIRVYALDGMFERTWNAWYLNPNEPKYARLLANAGLDKISFCRLTKIDGNVIDYKIIDLR